MIQNIAPVLRQGDTLQSKDQIISSLDVVAVPDIHHIGLFAVQSQGYHEVDRPGSRGQAPLVSAALLFRSVGHSERLDEVSDNVL
ncbi:MAG: hypothetical protein ACK56I_07125 [bacterium]